MTSASLRSVILAFEKYGNAYVFKNRIVYSMSIPTEPRFKNGFQTRHKAW